MTVDSEKAPEWRWKSTDRIETDSIYLTVKRTLHGVPKVNVLKTTGGVVKQIENFSFILVVDNRYGHGLEQGKARLQAMQGTVVYFCDHFHPNDGEDHTPAVRRMILLELGEFKMFNQLLPRYMVDIRLEDARDL